ncbi:MAG: ATPase P [Gemmatimonadetes bacterium]|jgi:soluble P-type ATPase|nr:ATPase P [Gemmatimonadota bacterium]MBT6143962.1 ATPase P [Gemmatimonadota bacterium]MBT7863339.1 ATPase P [Gemmatimonadota bacterium]
MIRIDIPDFGPVGVAHIVCDYNGTLAENGELLPGVSQAINEINDAKVHVITADTFGVAGEQLADTKCQLTIAPQDGQAQWKLDYVRSLGAHHTVAIGNGRNDRLMLQEAALGIALIQGEGAAVQTVQSAQILCTSITDALALFTNPNRLIATLRS